MSIKTGSSRAELEPDDDLDWEDDEDDFGNDDDEDEDEEEDEEEEEGTWHVGAPLPATGARKPTARQLKCPLGLMAPGLA